MDLIDLSIENTQRGRLTPGASARGDRVAEAHGNNADLGALKKACRDFESILVHTLLKSMRKSLSKSEGIGAGSEMYTTMGDLELARTLAHGRGMGLGDLLFEQLKNRFR